MARGDDPKFDAWVETAKDVALLDAAKLLGARLKRITSTEHAGPCPACGGTDRFSINAKDHVWNCRSAEGGASVIDMVKHIRGCDFLTACEILTGEPAPQGARQETDSEREQREGKQRERAEAARAREEQDKAASIAKRKRDEEAIEDVLGRASPIFDTHAEAYLRGRGIDIKRRHAGDLRFVKELDYWGYADAQAERLSHLAILPGMVAIVRNVAGDIIGIHQTFLDPAAPRKWAPTGDTRRNAAKKIRGEAKGGLIRFGTIGERIAIGEGIETTFRWFQLGRDPDVSIACAISLGNMAGRSLGTLPHPKLKTKAGNAMPYPDGRPDMESPGMVLPEWVREVILLGDGDSEQYRTEGCLLTAGHRLENEGRTVIVDMAPPGQDWADVDPRRALVADLAGALQ